MSLQSGQKGHQIVKLGKEAWVRNRVLARHKSARARLPVKSEAHCEIAVPLVGLRRFPTRLRAMDADLISLSRRDHVRHKRTHNQWD